MKGYKIPEGRVEGFKRWIEKYPKDMEYAWGMSAIVEALEIYPLEELDESPWHTGTPTEKGDYLCVFDSATCPLYGWCIWDGEWGYLSGYNPSVYRMIAWQKINPYKEKQNGHTD